MVVIHVPVVGYAIYGAIKLAKLKKDPNYRAEMVPPLVGFAAMSVIGALNLAGVMSFGTATLLYMGAPLFVLCLIGLIFMIIKRSKIKNGK